MARASQLGEPVLAQDMDGGGVSVPARAAAQPVIFRRFLRLPDQIDLDPPTYGDVLAVAAELRPFFKWWPTSCGEGSWVALEYIKQLIEAARQGVATHLHHRGAAFRQLGCRQLALEEHARDEASGTAQSRQISTDKSVCACYH